MATLLQMSVSGALMVVAVLLVRLVALRRLPKRLFVALWLLVALRLLVPVWIPSPTSAFNLLSANSAPVANVGPDADDTPGGQESATELEKQEVSDAAATPRTGTQAAAQTESATSSATPPDAASAAKAATAAATPSPAGEASANAAVRPRHVVLAVWGAGAACCGTVFTVSYARQRRRFSDALPVSDPNGRGLFDRMVASAGLRRRVAVRQSDRIAAPLTYGIARPVVLMPSGFAWGDGTAARYVIAHELVHVRRFDGVLKLVLAVAACVHWFNPLAWTMYVLANRDIELSCDEAVVRSYGLTSRGAYARTLLAMGERESGLAPLLQSGFGKTALEERIGAIMRTERTSLAAAAASIALAVAIPAALATSAVEEPVGTATPSDAASAAPDGGADGAGTAAAGNATTPANAGTRLYTAEFGGFAPWTMLSDAPNPARPDDLLATYSDEEWGMLANFLEEACAVFYPAPGEANHELSPGCPTTGALSVAEFRAAALEAFASDEGRALLDKLAADAELAAYVEGVGYLPAADASNAVDRDVMLAALAYHALLPLTADNWDAHALQGSAAVADGGTASYRITLRVDDADLVSANEYAYTAAWAEQCVQNVADATSDPDNALAADGLTAEELAGAALSLMEQRMPCYGLSAELSVDCFAAGADGEGAASSASATYALTDEPLVVGGTDTGESQVEAGERYTRALAAHRLFSAYAAYGVTLQSIAMVDYESDTALDSLMYGADGTQISLPLSGVTNQIFFDGTPVARVYDPLYHDVVSSWFGTIAVSSGAVDVVIERDGNGAIGGARIGEAGEVDGLMQEQA